ncbi:MAG: T9SS type A sorting domain-containing protein [Candidatus Cloacimonetes bacterium]|nr:T9SS type A sorting domain-containing protein [Candidatus Cloacimonadota bacterium]
MKNIFIIVLVLISLNLFSVSDMEPENERKFDLEFYHTGGNVGLRISNFGFIGAGNNSVSPSCIWPYLGYFDFAENIGTEYLYQGALWVGAKKIRRNENGQILYWLPEANNENDVVPNTDPDWTSDLAVVVDTLTTVGFDGDADLYEFLPAYNPLESEPLGNQYFQYNTQEKVMSTRFSRQNFDDDNDGLIDEDDLGRPFNLDDETYCFSLPFDDDGDGQIDEDTSYPGYETSVAYYYDYSPFPNGFTGDRDWGSAKGSNDHVPLDIAIKQETYTWATQYYADMVIFKHTIINTDPLDTLYDVTNGIYIDADCGPANWGTYDVASDDLSSFYNGDQIKFAFSFDADGDGGLTNGYIGFLMVPNSDVEESCWYWTVGNGPDDSDPLDIFGSNPTANEKYWLMTAKNPDTSKYTDLTEEDQEQAADTRFLYSINGDQQGFDNPTENSINIPPLEEYSIHTVLFFANTLAGLIEQAILAKEFVQSGFDPSLMEGLPSIPYLISAYYEDNSAELSWNCYTTPDQQFVFYKLKDAPASTWTSIAIPVDQNVTTITGLSESEEYKFKVGVYYDEVYLESKTILGSIYTSSENEEIPKPSFKLANYPNPFNPTTTISFETTNLHEDAQIEIYNLKGQKIKKLEISPESIREKLGINKVVWNGKDEMGKTMPSGIYFYKLQSGNFSQTRKMILMK